MDKNEKITLERIDTMNRQSDISEILNRASQQLLHIEAEYKASLNAQEISTSLRIDIKNLLENLRSVLDYLAHEIREKYCISANQSDRFYFPITHSYSHFSAQVNQYYPSLKTASPAVWEKLEKWQPYHQHNKWLSNFNKINNENKHNSLVAQTRQRVSTGAEIKTKAGNIVSYRDEICHFGSNVFIGGVPIDPGMERPVPDPCLDVRELEWFDFFFNGIQISALKLLNESAKGIKAINSGLKPHL